MERHDVTDDEAFDMLKRASQKLNVRVVALAERVSQTGQSPVVTD